MKKDGNSFMDKILIIEDDEDLCNLIRDYLKIEGFEAVTCNDGLEGMKAAKEGGFSLIILDIMLPNIDGMTICRKLRESSHVPIIMASAKSGDTDKILSLGMGADDYITKPFSPMELVARVKAHLRRQSYLSTEEKTQDNVLVFGELAVYPDSYKVTLNGEEVKLTSREFQVLQYLITNSGKVFSKQQLYDNIWGFSEFIDDNTMAVYVKKLREKLGDIGKRSIKTVWGAGYKWEYKDE